MFEPTNTYRPTRLAGFKYNRSNRKFVPVGTIPKRTDSLVKDKNSHAVPPWLRSAVVRASDRQSEDPISIPGGAALCFFRLIQLSVHICRIEKKERSLIRWNGPDRNEFSI